MSKSLFRVDVLNSVSASVVDAIEDWYIVNSDVTGVDIQIIWSQPEHISNLLVS